MMVAGDGEGLGPRLVVLVGHPNPGSRTLAAAERAGELLWGSLRANGVELDRPGTVDLAGLAHRLLAGGRDGSTAVTTVAAVRQATVLVAASPTFRASYTGLLKLFLDLLPRDGLAGTVAVPMMTAGLPAHRRAVDDMLRPVLLALAADVPAAGISVMEDDFGRVNDVFEAWWDSYGFPVTRAVAELTKAREGAARC